MRTNEGRDVKMSNLPLTLVGISNVSTGGKLSQFDNGHLKQKPSEVVEKISESCQKLLKNFPTVGGYSKVRNTFKCALQDDYVGGIYQRVDSTT